MFTAALVVIVELGAWPFQIPMAVKELQAAGYLLRAAAKQGHDLMRTKKTMPVNEPEDVTVALRESHGDDCGSALESGKAGCHPATLPGLRETKKA